MKNLTHAEHVDVDALPADCIEGECEHLVDEHGCITDAVCPVMIFRVCVDCMEQEGHGRDPGGWEELPLEAWPHPGCPGWTETPGGNGAGYVVNDAIFKERPESTEREPGQ